MHGRGFWIRPLLVELLCGLGVAGLYCWEIGWLALYPADMPQPPNPALPLNLPFILHEQYIAHAILIWFMLAASLIDVDEKIIPDALSRPGTLAGLLLAAIWPWSLLPDVQPFFSGKWILNSCASPLPTHGRPGSTAHPTAARWPSDWPAGRVVPGHHAANLVCPPRLHQGVPPMLGARQCARPTPIEYCAWAWPGCCSSRLSGIAAATTGPHFCSALVGMALGGGIIWAVRIIGGEVLDQEAMGFGDVTLMSMIGGVSGLAMLLDHFFPGPFCGPGRGIAAVFLPP